MNKILAIGAAVLSVASLGVALTRGGGEPAPQETPAPAVETGRRAEAGPDEARIAALEMEVSRLSRRVAALERPVLAKPGEPAAAMSTEEQAKQLQSLRSDVDALLTGEPMQTEEGRKRLKDVVRALQDEMFADRTKERLAQQDQERTERLKKFIEDARLSSTQAQDLTKVLDDEAQQRRALWDARRGGGAAGGPGAEPTAPGQPSAREQMRTLREKTDESAKSLLSADQFTQYQAMRSEERGGNRGPGGSGGGRRGQ